MIRRKWTAQDADEWTLEDAVAIVLSPLIYIGYAVGTALSLLTQTSGYVILGLSVAGTFFLYWVVDPKLSAVSTAYEARQQMYLERLRRIALWEDLGEDEAPEGKEPEREGCHE